MCVFVCESFLVLNMVVWFVRDVLCDVVRCVFLCVLSVFVCACCIQVVRALCL